MTSSSYSGESADHSLWSAFLPLLPLMLVVFIGFTPMGMALPVLPRHLHDALGQGTVMVGVVMGSQFVASLFARLWAGAVADARGAKPAVVAGLVAGCGVGVGYVVSVGGAGVATPAYEVIVLIGARLLVGLAEGFIITASLVWGIARVGPENAGKVIGWIGVALFAAYAAGAPLGVALHARFGLGGVGIAASVVSLLALAIAAGIAGVTPSRAQRLPVVRVIGAIRLPGLALTCTAAGFAMINAFAALLFVERGWGSGALAFSGMGAGFVLARFLFGHLPDKLGGARVALVCVLGEALGLLLLWGAPGAGVATLGAVLTGGGYALGFQGFGVEAVKRAPPASRGSAMGGYVAFQDICMGLAAPLGGVLAHVAGIASVYLVAAVLALVAAALAALMLRE